MSSDSDTGKFNDAEVTLEELESYNNGILQVGVGVGAEVVIPEWGKDEKQDLRVHTNTPLSETLGLKRNEVAEVVAIEKVTFRALHMARGNSGTTPGTARIDAQLSVNDFPDFGSATYPVDSDNPDALDEDDDGLDEWIVRDSSVKPGNPTEKGGNLLWKEEGVIAQAFNDTVNGTGGGGYDGIDSGHYMRNYRTNFGRGPLLYPDDEVFGTLAVDLNDWDNERIQVLLKTMLYLDIYESEESDYNDISMRRA